LHLDDDRLASPVSDEAFAAEASKRHADVRPRHRRGLRDLRVRLSYFPATGGNVPMVGRRLLEEQQANAFVRAAARHHHETTVGLCETQTTPGDELAHGGGAGRQVAQPPLVTHFDELRIFVGARFERRMRHLLARAETVVAEPVVGGDCAEQELAAGFVRADDAHTTRFESIDAVEWRLRQPQALSSL